jgi:hypothetical protein
VNVVHAKHVKDEDMLWASLCFLRADHLIRGLNNGRHDPSRGCARYWLLYVTHYTFVDENFWPKAVDDEGVEFFLHWYKVLRSFWIIDVTSSAN